MKKLIGSSILFFTSIIWGCAFIFQRVGMDSMPPLSFSAIRIAFAAIFIAVLGVLFEKKEFFIWDRKTLKGGIVCGALTTGVIAFQQAGLVDTNPGKVGFITALYIILVPIFGVLFMGRRESFRTWFGVGLGICGLYLLCVGQDSISLRKSDIFVMMCAICFAIHVLYISRQGKGLSPFKLNFIQLTICSVVCGLLALIFEKGAVTAENLHSAMPSILYTGIVSAGLGYTLQIVGQKHVKATVAALIMSLECVISVIADWLILHNALSTREAIGCVIMFVAMVIIQLPSKESKNG